MSLKEFLFVTRKILRLFVDTMTANDKYSVLNRGNLTEDIQMHLSQKQKDFFEFFRGFFKFTLNFEPFNKKMTLLCYLFPKLQTSIDVVRYMSKKSCLERSSDRQHCKWAETLIQSQCHHLHHIY